MQPGAIPTVSPTPAAEDGLIDYAGELQYGGLDCLRQFSATLAAIIRCPTTSEALAILTASAADNARVSKGAGRLVWCVEQAPSGCMQLPAV